MTPAEFTDLLDRYGADLERWPATERAAGQALLNQGPGEAWKQYRAAQLVEQLLREPVPVSDHQLMDRILAATHYQPEAQVEVGALFSTWQRGLAASAICLSLVAGLFTGWSEQTYQNTDDYTVSDDIPGLTTSPGNWGEAQ